MPQTPHRPLPGLSIDDEDGDKGNEEEEEEEEGTEAEDEANDKKPSMINSRS